MPPARTHGLLDEIPPHVLYYGALWVLVADGIFTGMAVNARVHQIWLGILAGLLVSALLGLLSFSRVAGILTSCAAAVLFAILIYAISAIVLLTVVVLIQIGLMHYVAFSILRSHWRSSVGSRLLSRGSGRAKPADVG